MAEPLVRLAVDDEAVMVVLDRLGGAMVDLTEPFDAIGVGLVSSGQRRFQTQTDPKGEKWAAWSPAYSAKRRAKEPAAKILHLRGHLQDSLTHHASRDRVETGSNLVYAAAQHHGRPEINLPSREYLGIDGGDEAMIVAELNHFLEARVVG